MFWNGNHKRLNDNWWRVREDRCPVVQSIKQTKFSFSIAEELEWQNCFNIPDLKWTPVFQCLTSDECLPNVFWRKIRGDKCEALVWCRLHFNGQRRSVVRSSISHCVIWNWASRWCLKMPLNCCFSFLKYREVHFISRQMRGTCF